MEPLPRNASCAGKKWRNRMLRGKYLWSPLPLYLLSHLIIWSFFFCHGDRFSGLINSAQTQSVSSRELREGLRILGGSDTLSEVEHQALFRNISRGQDRIQYKVSGHEIPIILPVIRGRHKEGDTHARTRARARTHTQREMERLRRTGSPFRCAGHRAYSTACLQSSTVEPHLIAEYWDVEGACVLKKEITMKTTPLRNPPPSRGRWTTQVDRQSGKAGGRAVNALY